MTDGRDDLHRCAICGREVDLFDPDVADEAGRTVCGGCARTRREDIELLWVMDIADGELDGEIG